MILDGGINHVNYFGQMMGMKTPVIITFPYNKGNELNNTTVQTETQTLCGSHCTDLIDSKILSSFDIIQIISVIDEEYDVAVPATEIIPANFNSAQAIYDMIQRLK